MDEILLEILFHILNVSLQLAQTDSRWLVLVAIASISIATVSTRPHDNTD